MKHSPFIGHHRLSGLLVLLALTTCGNRELPPDLIGDWKSGEHKITVRTEPEKGRYQFTSKTRVSMLTIHADKTASGTIGRATFENAPVKRNPGNPDKTGVAYIIQCGSIGKIFMDDPLENKEVEIWLAPLKEDLPAELRYTEGSAEFPMARMVFQRVEIEEF